MRRVRDTFVSLTFDDGLSSQDVARRVLRDHGLCGTFYVNPSRIGTEAHLGWDQLLQINGEGNEVGGHGFRHLDLTTLADAEVRRQLVTGRDVLSAHGLRQVTFAYPFGAYRNLGDIVRQCGYAAARRSWGLAAMETSVRRNDTPAVAETMPPRNVFAIRTMPCVRAQHTVDDLQSAVQRAERGGGGWLPFIFHGIGDGLNSYSVSTDVLGDFVSWLSVRESRGTFVRTVAEIATPVADAERRKSA